MRHTVGLQRIGLLYGTMALLLIAGPLVLLHSVGAVDSTLPNRYLKLSDSVATHTNVSYELGFDITSSSTLGSVEAEICSNDPFPATSCTVPPGLDVSGAVLVSQTGTNDFSIDVTNTNAHKIVFTRTPSVVAATTYSFSFSNVINPSNTGSIYVRLQTFSGANLGGSVTFSGGIAFSIIGDLTVSTEVPPHIDLCVGITVDTECASMTGDQIDFGTLTTSATATATSQFASATNAANGYTVSISGNSMTSGNHVIPPLSTMSVSTPGVNQFGFNLRQNISPSEGADPVGIGTANAVGNYAIPDNFTFNNGDVIASVNGPDNYRKFTASYILNIDNAQPPGYYATTLTFIALGSF